MKTEPQTLSTESIYKGKIFDVVESEIRHDDIQYKREIVIHKGSAVIVPVFDDGTVAMVRQYRYAAEKFLLEIPAGHSIKGRTRRSGPYASLRKRSASKPERLRS